MMKNWWKFLAVILLTYVTLFSLLTPLVPGGLVVNINVIKKGENNIEFTGYNTHFNTDQANLRCFISVGQQWIEGKVTTIESDAKFQFSVNLPDTLPSTQVAFYAYTPTDGAVYVSSAVGFSDIVIDSDTKLPELKNKVSNDEHQHWGFPFQPILFETIRNLMFHVPMWFTMFFLMGISLVASFKVLSGKWEQDVIAVSSAKVGLVFCVLGLITGSIWARFTWLTWWTKDPQLNGAMIVFIVYAAYLLLRNSIEDENKRARLSAVFNVFAFILMVLLLMVMPRMAEDSLHPGKSGNPAFSKYDLDSSLRAVFYPAVIGWGMLGYWIYTIQKKLETLKQESHVE